MKMNPLLRILTILPALMAATFNAQAAETPPASKPNIVFILVDDLGVECLGCYGSPYYKTPNIDKLAAGGARFLEAYSEPLCTPSRVQLLTGKHNFRNYTHFAELDLSQRTFAQALQEAGYKTDIAGKWQLSAGNFNGPFQAGFDEYCLWHFDNKKVGGKNEEEEGGKGSRYKSPKLYENGKEMPDTEGKYGPDITLDHLLNFIRKHQNEPFLAYFTSILTHDPFCPTPDSPKWAESNPLARSDTKEFKGMVEYMDKQVGEIVKTLDELHLREKTLIIFTADNGTNKTIVSPFPVRKEIRGGKGLMIDDGNHVGFIGNWPGTIPAGTVVKTQIDFTDVFPTFCAVSGAALPKDLYGQNLLPFMKGDESNARGWVFQSFAREGVNYRYFVRQGPYKLYATGQLYDVPHDWLEKNPLKSPELEPVRQKLEGILQSVMSTGPQGDSSPKGKSKNGSQPKKGKKKTAQENENASENANASDQ